MSKCIFNALVFLFSGYRRVRIRVIAENENAYSLIMSDIPMSELNAMSVHREKKGW